MKREKHINIPIFVVHMGCPNQCVFCDQRLISGSSCFSEDSVRGTVNTALAQIRETSRRAEIAFFGGSFTGIERGLMIRLLDLAEEYVRRGDVYGIRLSTRPDYIDGEILGILSRYTVCAVELGIQSISDEVLARSRRGHTAADAIRACTLLRAAGIPTVGQMMIGLPGSAPADEIRTAEMIAEAGAVGFRLYPTLVFRNTELASMTERGEYVPLSVSEAVERMRDVLDVMDRRRIPCLRAGLCESENLHDPAVFLAGPNHPAIGELARSALFLTRIEENLRPVLRALSDARVLLEVPRGAASAAAGQHRANTRYLMDKYGIKNIKILENDALIGYNNRIGILMKETDIYDKKAERK